MNFDVFPLVDQVPIEILGRCDQIDHLCLEVNFRNIAIVSGNANCRIVDIPAIVTQQRLAYRIGERS